MPEKCPHCGGNNMDVYPKPTQGDAFFIPIVDRETSEVKLSEGLALLVYGCPDCKSVIFKDPTLHKE